MESSKHDPEPQPEMSVSDQLDYELHSLRCDARRLLDTAALPWRLHDLLELLVRSLQGCSRCHAVFGHRHEMTCGVLGGSMVLRSDLAPYVAGEEPLRQIAPF